MKYFEQSLKVKYNYRVYFTSLLFDPDNKTFCNFFVELNTEGLTKIIFVIDSNVAANHQNLISDIDRYFKYYPIAEVVSYTIIPGGEEVKNKTKYLDELYHVINDYKIDRHSYLIAIGGGAVLDLAGYAAATAHRGIKHIRVPTTVLSQNDSGVGVKNSINAFGKKNFIGTFSPPEAVFNDDNFLNTISARDRRAGLAEAIKVALIKDADFFEWIEYNADNLLDTDNKEALNALIERCAELHLAHISTADPFERTTSRPLDFGHWSAHKLETLSNFDILHGEAVAMGIAIDTAYSFVTGKLNMTNTNRILNLLLTLGFCINYPQAQITSVNAAILTGLQEFREHLGGKLSIPLLTDIGTYEDTHDINPHHLITASNWLNTFNSTIVIPSKFVGHADQQL